MSYLGAGNFFGLHPYATVTIYLSASSRMKYGIMGCTVPFNYWDCLFVSCSRRMTDIYPMTNGRLVVLSALPGGIVFCQFLFIFYHMQLESDTDSYVSQELDVST